MVGASDVLKVGDWFVLTRDVHPRILHPSGTLILCRQISLEKGTHGPVTRFWRQVWPKQAAPYPPGQHVEMEFDRSTFWICKLDIVPASMWLQ